MREVEDRTKWRAIEEAYVDDDDEEILYIIGFSLVSLIDDCRYGDNTL